MKNIVAFGEMMMRLSPPENLRFFQANSFEVSYSGAEFNTLASLQSWGISTQYVTKLPDNDFGDKAISEIARYRVGSHYVIKGGNRLGIYFLEKGSSLRHSKVIYDRAESALAKIREGEIDWEEVLSGASWFHWSGITPGVSGEAARECLLACKTAKKLGLKISCDLNYRSTLWKWGKEPYEVLPEILGMTNVILSDLSTLNRMLGKEPLSPDYKKPDSLYTYYEDILKACPDLEYLPTTLRYSESASHQKIGGIMYASGEILTSKTLELLPVVDRLGTGDAFMAGIIYGLVKKLAPQEVLDFAVATGAYKHTMTGDINLASLEEIHGIMKGNLSALIKR